MKNILILAITLLICAYASAGELNLNSANFDNIKTDRINTSKINPPVPTMKILSPIKRDIISGKISRLHLIAQTSKKSIYTFADTKEEFNEFVNMWTPILNKAGLKPGKTEYKNTMVMQHYESAENYVLRDFWADRLHYDALDENDILKLQNELIAGLRKRGMPTIAAFKIKNDIVRPTFKLYYLTKQNENPDREIRLRHLMRGLDIDYDRMEKAGINIVKKDADFSMVYIGKELGFVSRIGKTKTEVEKKLIDYKKFLKENSKEFIDAKIFKLDEPVYDLNYGVHIYFYQ